MQKFSDIKQQINERKNQVTANDLVSIYSYDKFVGTEEQAPKPTGVEFVDGGKRYQANSFHSTEGPFWELFISEKKTDEKIRMRQYPRAAYAATSQNTGTKTEAKRDPRALFAMARNNKNTAQVDSVTSSSQGIIQTAGWKFHVSVEQSEENKANAWNTLVPILAKYKVGESKITERGIEQHENKVITIYTFRGGPEQDQWEPFIQEVEKALKDTGVKPGGQIDENKLSNSEYFYYRNDAGSDGKYTKGGNHVKNEHFERIVANPQLGGELKK